MNDAIARYEQAVERERQIRTAAFLDAPERIGEFEVVPMTLDRLSRLKMVGSPFITFERPPDAADCAQFLWALSPQYPWGLDEKRRIEGRCRDYAMPSPPRLHLPWLIRRWATRAAANALRLAGLLRDISEYIDATMIDRPPTREEAGPSYYSELSWYCHECGEHYGWSIGETMGVPLKALFQMLKLQRAMEDAKRGKAPVMFNPSDRLKSELLN